MNDNIYQYGYCEIGIRDNNSLPSVFKEERCSTSSSVTDEDKIDNDAENIKGDNESSEKTVDNATTTNDEASTSPLLQPAGDEKLASEYEQFMKMVCTDIPLPSVTDMAKEYSPKKNPIKSASPPSYHEFNIESNLVEDNASIELPLKEKDKLLEGSIKSVECEESTLSTDCQIQINEDNVQVERTNDDNETEDSKSIPSDWENVRIKVERLSDENTEFREIKKKKKQKKREVISSSDTSSSTSSSNSEKEKKKRKRKRKILSNSSSSDSESTDSSSSSSSDSSSSDEKRKRKRKKKKVGKKRKKARRAARTKKKRRRKMSTDSSSSDSDECIKKKRKLKKKTKEAKQFDAKSINNGDMSKVISKSPVIASPSNGTKLLHPVTSAKKVKEEAAIEETKRADQVTSARKSITGINDNECTKQRGEKKESKADESLLEEWELDSMLATQQNDGDTSSQDVHTGERELGKISGSEKDKHRRKRKRENEQKKDKLSVKDNEERIYSESEKTDEEREIKKKKRKEKNVRSSTEFLADWERESERITQQIIQNETRLSKKLEKQKKEKWGEMDFDTLNVPSLTQLEKEVCRKQLLADEWEVDSLEAISELIVSKRKSTSKKTEKEVRYDKKTDTYIAIDKESAREMKKRQERLCAIRIWEEEQEEGEKEEMMLLEQKSKHKKDDWDIEEESSFLHKTNEDVEIHKVDDAIKVEEWNKLDEDTGKTKEDSSKLMMKLEPVSSKRVRKSRWDMSTQSEEKAKDLWEEEYVEWSKIEKCEQEVEKMDKGDVCTTDYSKSSAKSDLIDFYPRTLEPRESLERPWTSEEMATTSVQAEKVEDASKNLISVNEEIVPMKKEHPIRDQFKEILDFDVKFKEKTVELYSPSSPALSQKSQVYLFVYLYIK